MNTAPEPASAPRRLYMDNAATSFPKPRGVLEAMTHYATRLGASAGRGAYAEAIETASLLTQCRRRVNRLIHGERAEHVIFTLNCTDALHLAIRGMLDPGQTSHVICTQIDHNSILRPFREMERRGWVQVTRVPVEPGSGLVDPEAIRRAVRSDTRLIAVTHASNVTGTLQPLAAIGRVARERAVPLLVDAAQSIGHVEIDVQADGVDLLAAPGHKALFGPLGTGFLYIRPGVEKALRTVREGGTGSASEEDLQPAFMPDRFESGSHNALGIAGLSEGVQWVLERTLPELQAHELALTRTFLDGLAGIEGLRLLGPPGVRDRVGVFSVAIEGLHPHELSALLETRYGILTRSGIHCAPGAHEAMGTLGAGGATRFSFSAFLATQDVKYAADALSEVAAEQYAVR